MPSKLKPLVLLGIAGGIVAAVRKRAAGTASDIADRTKEAVSSTPGESGSREETRRFTHPAEAEAQAPSEPGETPSEESQATVARSVPAEAADTPDDSAVQEADGGATGDSTTEETKP